MKLLMQDMLDKLTGEIEELLQLLKIKVSVDHVGHLLQLLLMKAIKFNLEVNLNKFHSVNNNLLIVLQLNHMETKVVMEDMELEHWNILKILDRLQLLPILIKQLPQLVNLQVDIIEFMELPKLQDAQIWINCSKEDLWLLELMLLIGILINKVFLTLVIPNLIMLYF